MAHLRRRIRHTLPAIGLGVSLMFAAGGCGNSDDTSAPDVTSASSSSGKPGATPALRKACVSTNDEVVKANASWNSSVETKSPSSSGGSSGSAESGSGAASSSNTAAPAPTASGGAPGSSPSASSASGGSLSPSATSATAAASDIAGAAKEMKDLAASMRKAGTDSGNATFRTKAEAVAVQVETLASAGTKSKSVDTTAYNNAVDDLTAYCSTMFPQPTASSS